jgi:hypothetical protein
MPDVLESVLKGNATDILFQDVHRVNLSIRSPMFRPVLT